jgi:predicted TIM-barrel fold metal-dependent hydrolase
MNRRNFFSVTGASAAGIIIAENVKGISVRQHSADPESSETKQSLSYDIMKDALKYRKIDGHIHVYLFDGGPENNIDFADRLGINHMMISRPIAKGGEAPANFRGYNDLVLKAMKMYPGRFTGEMTLNPIYQKESLEEIKRCVDLGMVGLKVYTQAKINDPLFYPIIEKFIDLKMIILMHGHCQLGVGGYRKKYETGIRPNTSTPDDFVDAAKRYPEAMLQYAHIGGGGDWEYACKAFKNYPNLYVDTSGSNNPGHMVDFAVEQMGEDRVFFGSDNCYYQSIGKILASNLTESQKRKLFFDNYNNVLKKSGNGIH